MKRSNDRAFDQLRDVNVETGIISNAEGSALIKFGNTHVICTASIENSVPRWMKNSNEGWITAEYGMLPRSTHERMGREAARGKQSGRTQEIQRLIGRSLRQSVNLEYLKDHTVTIDCDVIQADGGTRTASITGGCIALFSAIQNKLKDHRAIKKHVAAISIGLLNDQPILDLDYTEDSMADVDANFVFAKKMGVSEVQISGEKTTFNLKAVSQMLKLSLESTKEIFLLQEKIIGKI